MDIEDIVKELTAKLKEEKINKLHIALAATLSLTIMVFFSLAGSDQVLTLDQESIGKINSKKTYEQALKIIQEEKEEELGYTINDLTTRIELDPKADFKGKKIKDPQVLADLIRPYVVCQTEVFSLKVNGQDRVFLKTEEEALNLLEDLKTGFLKEGEEILSYEFKEEVEVVAANAASDSIMTQEDALNFVLTGTDKIETYKVAKGDTLSQIAQRHGMGLSKLKEANPQLKGDFLSIGQELKLVKLEPVIHVVVAKEVTKEEVIPFPTKYTNSADLWAGQTQVKKAGTNGLKEVTYKVVMENGREVSTEEVKSMVLKEASVQEVLRGTQQMTASRGGGDGQLAWPRRGSITSRYGPRGSGFHTGLDISGKRGDPIYAAGNGRVIFASWSGNYGNLIIIDHGNGLTTKYAHLTAYKVSLGQEVKRGDLVGTVGSTGRSTGSHLHFETNVNSRHVDPMRYLGN